MQFLLVFDILYLSFLNCFQIVYRLFPLRIVANINLISSSPLEIVMHESWPILNNLWKQWEICGKRKMEVGWGMVETW